MNSQTDLRQQLNAIMVNFQFQSLDNLDDSVTQTLALISQTVSSQKMQLGADLLKELNAKAIITLDTDPQVPHKALNIPVGPFVRLADLQEALARLLGREISE